MRKFISSLFILPFLILSFTGCNTIGDKSGNFSVIYIITATLSLLLLISCIFLVRKNKLWFITLFSSVLVVNSGYAFLAFSTSLEMALWANRISYLGSVFLPLAMLMILLSITNTPYKEWLPKILTCIAVVVFLIAASPGILDIYYKTVDFKTLDNGVATLIKVYGPLHPIYLIYLLGYFSSMVALIVRANIKKTIDTTAHAIIIAIAVFVNIGVWFIEQLIAVDFEMLSVSYIISELFLLGVHLVMNEYQKMSRIVNEVKNIKSYSDKDTLNMLENSVENKTVSTDHIEIFLNGLKTLTPSEKSLYDAYVARLTTKEIMENMHIKESTLKYHSRNLYGKLGVSTRKELLETYKHIKNAKSKFEEAEK